MVQFTKGQRLLITFLMDTWRVTKQGLEIEEMVVKWTFPNYIQHGETAKSFNRGRNGVANDYQP